MIDEPVKAPRHLVIALNLDPSARVGAGREVQALTGQIIAMINATNKAVLNDRRRVPVFISVFRGEPGELLRDRGVPVTLSVSARSTGGISVVPMYTCERCGGDECAGDCGKEIGSFLDTPLAESAKVKAPEQWIVGASVTVNLRGTGVTRLNRGHIVTDPGVVRELRAAGVVLQSS